MSKIKSIVLKELKTYFKSPLAYIILFTIIVTFNVFFFMIMDENREATLREVFKLMEFMFVFFIPILTMKIFAEENYLGTMELLLTTPLTKKELVVGKYLAALFLPLLIIVATLPFVVILEIFASPDCWEIFWGYIGIILEVMMFVSIGLLCSIQTRSQVIAAIVSYVIIFSLYFSFAFIKYLPSFGQEIVRFVSTMPHLENFSVGYFSLADVIYYLSIIWFCLFAARLHLEKEK